jgi:uncharacterized secreted protein with C-terminal beta-propeller domain
MKSFKVATAKIFVTGSAFALVTSCGLFNISKKDDPAADISADIEQLRQTKPLDLTGNLKSFSSCDEVLSHLKDDMIQQLTGDIVNQMIWINKSRSTLEDDQMVSAKSASTSADESESGNSDSSDGVNEENSSAPSDHSETNNQVAGVEEADIVKTDGTHIYHVARGKLHILKSWPASQLAEISVMDLNLRPIELFLDKERKKVVVIGNRIKEQVQSIEYDDAIEEKESADSQGWFQVDSETVLVAIIDVTDPSIPKLEGRHSFSGSYNNSRRIGGSVRLILQAATRYPQDVSNYLPYDQTRKKTKKEKIDSLRALLISGRDKIKEQDLNFFLKLDGFTKEEAGVVSSSLNIGNCENIRAPTVASPTGFTHILTLNLDSEEVTNTSILTYADKIYSSETSLYIAAQYFWRLPLFADGDYTFIHKLDLSNPSKTSYMGSGQVEGYLLNQFAMDEYENNLRVAVTVPAAEAIDGTEDENSPSVNRVSVMSMDGDLLKVVGTTPDLAPGERIFSVRFAGNRGFVVTFRQVDPLYTLDLANPTEPKVVGELKIPGYSSYLQMLGDNHLLAVGRDGTDEGQIRGLKVSIFDVSDMANPKESHTFVLGQETWSEAEWNHKAFTYFPAKKLLGIPVSGYEQTRNGRYRSGYFSKIAIFGVDVDTGITDKGSLAMENIFDGVNANDHWWNTGAHVQRSIFADDFVYAISDLGVRAANLDDLSNPVGTVRYRCDKRCFEQWSWW